MNTLFARHFAPSAALLIVFAQVVFSADAPTVRAALQSPANRKPAPAFALKDGSNRTASLKDYRGKVVLLDFWATWCHGCKEELPWFAEFQRKYGKQGLEVVGVSLDDEGWKVVKPFISDAKIPYRIVLGDAAAAKIYHIDSMPDAFLIDRHGALAATYVGLVDKDNLETNIRSMLAER